MIKDKLGRSINIDDGVLFSLKDTLDIRFGTVVDISEYYIKIEVNDKRGVQILKRNAKHLIKLSNNNYIAKEMYKLEHKF